MVGPNSKNSDRSDLFLNFDPHNRTDVAPSNRDRADLRFRRVFCRIRLLDQSIAIKGTEKNQTKRPSPQSTLTRRVGREPPPGHRCHGKTFGHSADQLKAFLATTTNAFSISPSVVGWISWRLAFRKENNIANGIALAEAIYVVATTRGLFPINNSGPRERPHLRHSRQLAEGASSCSFADRNDALIRFVDQIRPSQPALRCEKIYRVRN
jgi:hypothetical protein